MRYGHSGKFTDITTPGIDWIVSTLWWPLLPYGYSYECQSARMSKITLDGLTRSGTWYFIVAPISWQQWASKCYFRFSHNRSVVLCLMVNCRAAAGPVVTSHPESCWRRTTRTTHLDRKFHARWKIYHGPRPRSTTLTSAVYLSSFVAEVYLDKAQMYETWNTRSSSSIWPHLSYGLVRGKREYYHYCSLVVLLCSFL